MKRVVLPIFISFLLIFSFLPIPQAHATQATGGTITYSGGNTIHTFTTSGTFTVTTAGDVDYLVVAGGGGGGGDDLGSGGGGGAGGFRNGTGHAVTVQGYTITVGAGGAGGANNALGVSGGNSIFDTITSAGGGGGGNWRGVSGVSADGWGYDGGSGGGGGQEFVGTAAAGNTPSTSPSQGYDGGRNTQLSSGGGGGGAGGAGGNSQNPQRGGVGGIGATEDISGTITYYAGGGGGGTHTNCTVSCAAPGGNGGGGAGADSGVVNAVAGTANTGGGGGAGAETGYTSGAGGSGIVIISYLTANPPDPVTTLTSTAIGSTTVNLDWTAPSAGTGTIIGYQINATTPQTGNPLVWLNDTGSTNTDHIVTGLSANTDYSFRVSAWTEVGNDATGNVYNATTLNPVASTPTNLVATSSSISIIGLDWDDAPVYDNITGFRIFRESPTGNGWTLHTSDTASSVSALSDTGLTTKTQYNYMIAGINGTGVGSNSTAAAATTYGVPDAITDLSLGATSTTITLTWSAPTVYGYPITGYKIEYESPVGGGYATLVANTGTTAVTYVHTGLTAFTQYGYKVTAISSFGNSAASNQPSSYTVTNPPVLNVVNDCYHTCTTQLNLEWSAPTGTILGYKIEHNLNSAGYATLVANTTNTNVFYNATGLSAGDIVSYRVSAHSAYGTSIPSNAVQYSTHMLPNAVTTLAATETSLSSVVLAWTQPTLNSHSILCNMINYTTPTGDPQTIITSCTSTTAATYEITGLALGDPNSFRVSAVTSHGTNSSGNIVNATAFSDFTIGAITIENTINPNIVDVRFESAVVGSTTTVDVIYPNTVSDFRCDLSYQYAMTNQTYSGLTATAYDTDYDTSEFNLVDANNEVITFYCWDASAPTVEGTYQVSQTSFPFIDQAMLFRDGTTFKTDGDFGGIDLITLIVIIVSMVGFNRTNPAAGLIISVMILGATSYFGLIEIPTIVMSAFVLIVMLAIVTTRKG